MFYLGKKLQALALSIFLSSGVFGAAERNEPSPEELTRTYLRYLPHSPQAMNIPIDSAEKGIVLIAHHLKETERVEHSNYIKENISYGCSFTSKNESPMQSIVDALTDKRLVTIADVGCGLAFSTIDLILKTIELCKTGTCVIHIDLYDISQEHEEPLTALATLINMAFPRYFKVRTFVHDAAQAFPEQDCYQFVLGLNFMHYVPQAKWRLVLQNLENSMKKDSMLFLTVDHYLSGLSNKGDVDTLEAAVQMAPFPFIIPSVHLLKKASGKEVGTQITNLKLSQITNEESDEAKEDGDQHPQKMSAATPGKRYDFKEIHINNFKALLEVMLRKKSKPSDRNLPEAQIQMIVKAMLRELPLGNLWIQLGCYRFNEELFERALEISLGKGSRLTKQELDWSKHLPINIDGSPSSVGMTFIKG